MKVEGFVVVVTFPDGFEDYTVFNHWGDTVWFSHEIDGKLYSFESEVRHLEVWCLANDCRYSSGLFEGETTI